MAALAQLRAGRSSVSRVAIIGTTGQDKRNVRMPELTDFARVEKVRGARQRRHTTTQYEEVHPMTYTSIKI